MNKNQNTLKLRSNLAVKREYFRIQRMVLKNKDTEERPYLYGAQQALAWVFDDCAASPAKAFKPKKQRRLR